MNSAFWDERHLSNKKGWDVGEVTTPIKEYVDGLKQKNIAILIPGCGNAYEAEYLLQSGFTNITLIDISPVLVGVIKKKFQHHLDKEIKVLCGNFFELQGKFDLIIEQTFFCAIDPTLRRRYVEKMYELLHTGGSLVGVLFNKEFEEKGPPFGGNKEEYLSVFEEKLKLIKMELCYNSIKPRENNELFFIASKE